ncbi:ATP-binding protein [Gelidibacter sp. F2691]|nr:ATP-binding protein [Gelidibacter sp. F2691]
MMMFPARSMAGWPTQAKATDSNRRASILHSAAKQHKTQTLELKFPSDAMSVRQALHHVLALDLTADEKSVAEIVLAEVLNNIVEHAYQERPTGMIELLVEQTEKDVRVRVYDNGIPLPGGLLERIAEPDLDCPTEDLPEGGFGWLLVRELTQNLRYERVDQRNCLAFSIAINGSEIA